MRTPLLVALVLVVTATVAAPASAADIDFDLRTWSKEGPEGEGNWEVASDGSEVIQTLNEDPTYFVSPESVEAATITGVFEVQTTRDDDYIGFVFGYAGPTAGDPYAYDHLLFDWKGSSQTGFGGCTSQEGFSLMRIEGTLDDDPDERYEGNGMVLPVHWCHEQAEDDPRAEVLATDWGEDRGWESNTEYEFVLEYTPDRVRIFIDGEQIFDVSGTFPAGSFGFYNYSQAQVRYSGFEATDPPPEDQPDGERLEGGDRFDTAVEISRDSWEDGAASGVVLARADVFADALAGTPYAVAVGGPLLITPRDALRDGIAAEIRRVLGDDTSRTVHLLGGPVALSPEVESSVRDLGYAVKRVAGSTRIETAIEIARLLPRTDAFLVTTGYDFPDALAAGPAAVAADGAVLLSARDEPASATTAFMDSRSDVPRFAVGGPAAAAYPGATAVTGSTRTATAVAVARRFFPSPRVVGVARSDDFPDSLAGGAHIAMGLPELGRLGGPMLLTPSDSLADEVGELICGSSDSIDRAFVYGGPAAIAPDVEAAVVDRVDGSGCS